MSSELFGADRTFDINRLEQWIDQIENSFGPLQAVGCSNALTWGEFNWQSKSQRAILDTKVGMNVGGTFVLPAGSTEVCRGKVFVTNQVVEVVVYRR